MKNLKIIYLLPIILVMGGLWTSNNNASTSAYTSITQATAQEQNQQVFNTMMSVLTHKRCTNCHPSNDIPKQGEDSHPHYFGLQRGQNNTGFKSLKCNSCHQSENNDYSGVPGAPHWSLAPKSMAWAGLSPNEIATSMLDKSKNGNRSHEELIHHLTKDSLVQWAFKPGVNAEGIPREKPAVSQDEFHAAVEEWFKNGAIIPNDK